MDWLNYHHLLYFWTAVREGGIARAAEKLRLSHPTLSAQIRTLEESLGEKLFQRKGRSLEPTEMGRVVYGYADEIFGLGRELLDVVRGRPTGRPQKLRIGVVDALPKLVARELLAPARGAQVRLVISEASPDELLTALAGHTLDLILSDGPVPQGSAVRAFGHLLGESGVTIFAAPRFASRYKRGFPQSLDGAPFLLPTQDTALRRSLDAWFEGLSVKPLIVAEVADNALLESLGEDGDGLFPSSTAVEEHVARRYGVEVVGRAPQVRSRFYAISAQRRVTHPAVKAIQEAARSALFH
ncbi:MAG: LysR family transcriptional regulator [Myxococcales bacterium]